MSSALALTKADLDDFFEVTPERFNRANVTFSPGFQVLHLTLAPGQGVPNHTHPGRHVLLQGLKGSVAVELDSVELDSVEMNSEVVELEASQLLHFSGETPVALRNGSDEACAVLIVLAKKVQE